MDFITINFEIVKISHTMGVPSLLQHDACAPSGRRERATPPTGAGGHSEGMGGGDSGPLSPAAALPPLPHQRWGRRFLCLKWWVAFLCTWPLSCNKDETKTGNVKKGKV